ncbi:hypothetical protein [Dyella lutea]|uniref:Uncharacterized protein n=1 Tax=Dyella lutea TaxID=2950441 RepID=A0ABT1FF15_9GAMM|nr:hypothetical protein [Dyella lutea]MCP1375983.1 hypothetical protein [Dyella lutea]
MPDLSPALCRLIDSLAQHAVQEYLTGEAAQHNGQGEQRPNHPTLPSLNEAA